LKLASLFTHEPRAEPGFAGGSDKTKRPFTRSAGKARLPWSNPRPSRGLAASTAGGCEAHGRAGEFVGGDVGGEEDDAGVEGEHAFVGN